MLSNLPSAAHQETYGKEGQEATYLSQLLFTSPGFGGYLVSSRTLFPSEIAPLCLQFPVQGWTNALSLSETTCASLSTAVPFTAMAGVGLNKPHFSTEEFQRPLYVFPRNFRGLIASEITQIFQRSILSRPVSTRYLASLGVSLQQG